MFTLAHSLLLSQKADCPKRPVVCPYCELDLVQDQLAAHTDYCGTRTEPCLKCSQYIMHKDLARHEESNCTYPEPKPKPATNPTPAQGRGIDYRTPSYDYSRYVMHRLQDSELRLLKLRNALTTGY